MDKRADMMQIDYLARTVFFAKAENDCVGCFYIYI